MVPRQERAIPDPASRPALLVANAHSRRGREVEPLVAALERGGLTLMRRTCRRREELAPLIRSVRAEVGCVILAGGDGTLNAAATALRDTGLPLGILPLGTANDMARTLGIPVEGEAAVQVILAGRVGEVDLGCVNGHPFFNVASMGLSVDITQRLTGLMKRHLGRLAYPVAAAMVIAVGNGRFYGGGMVVEASARIDDQRLDLYSLEPRARWRLLLMAKAFRAGDHGSLAEVRTLRCRAVRVTTRKPRHVSADGEIVTQTPAQFTLLPRAVRVFVP